MPTPQRQQPPVMSRFLRGLTQWARSLWMASANDSASASDSPWDRGTSWKPAYDAADRGRLFADWDPGISGPNAIHRREGKTLLARLRDLDRNNPHAVSAVNAYLRNVLASGITPKADLEDTELRSTWEDEWEHWAGVVPGSRFHCDVAGRATLYDLVETILKEVLIGGGCLVVFSSQPLGEDGRRLPLALEIIPEERIADEHDRASLGPWINGDNGNPIVRGIEIDKKTSKHVAYHVKAAAVNDDTTSSLEIVRIPASQCRYLAFHKQVGEVRGTSLFVPATVWMRRLGTYVDSEMVAANMKSQWAFAITASDDSPDVEVSLHGDDSSPLTDVNGNPYEHLQPGSIFRGRPGDKIAAVGPNVPQTDSVPWLLLMQQAIAMAVDLSEVELTRDYSRVSFTSSRAAANRDRKTFRKFQEWIVNQILNEIWFRFVESAVMVGRPGFPSPSEYQADESQWLRVTWQFPGWPAVNPVDEARADQINLANKTVSRQEIIANRGPDWEQTFRQLKAEEDMIDALGLNDDQPTSGNAADDAPSTADTSPANAENR